MCCIFIICIQIGTLAKIEPCIFIICEYANSSVPRVSLLDDIHELPDNYSDSIASEQRPATASEQTLAVVKQEHKKLAQTSEEESEAKAELEKRQQDEREAIQSKIRSISAKQQSSIFIVILILFLLLTSYFVGMYLYTRHSLQEYRQSFVDIRKVHDRSICLSKLFFFAREDLLTASEASLSNGASDSLQGYKSLSMDQLWRCMNLEQEFTDLKRTGDAYLDQSKSEVSKADNSDGYPQGLCRMVQQYAGPVTKVTQTICQSIQNSVFNKGLSLSHQDFIKSVLITLLDYFSRVTDFSTVLPKNATQTPRGDFILTKLRTSPFLEYLYSNELMLTHVNARIASQVVDSVLKYIDKLESVQISLFTALQIALIVIILYFLFYMFNRMKKDMLSSHLMIAMLPKHLLSKDDQTSIRDFLMA